MMSKRWYSGALSIGLLGLIGVTACSSDSSKSSSSGFFARSLAQIPASVRSDDGQIELNAADLDAATKLATVARPADGTTGDDLSTWLMAITGGGKRDTAVSVVLPIAVNPINVANAKGFADELGWSVSDVHSFVEYQLPPEVFTVLTGNFSDDALTATLGAPTDGIWKIGGQDNEVDPGEVSDARRLGEALRFAHTEDHLAVARATPIIADWQKNAGKQSATLAGDAQLMSVAKALDDSDAYAGMLFEEDFALSGGRLTPEEAAKIEDQTGIPATGRFTALGAGLAVSNGAPTGILVYVYPGDEAAKTGADGVRKLLTEGVSFATLRPWNELFSDPEVKVDGSVVIATFGFSDFSPPNFWRMVAMHDSLTTSALGQ